MLKVAPLVALALLALPMPALAEDTPGTDHDRYVLEKAGDGFIRLDRETGAESRPLTEEQKTAVAEARQVYQARVAEREILHRSALAKAASAEEVEGLNLALRRDLDRLATDRDRKIAQVRGEQPPAQAE